MLPSLVNKAVVAICLWELFGLILGVEHYPSSLYLQNFRMAIMLLEYSQNSKI
jgi:hypothetical protein